MTLIIFKNHYPHKVINFNSNDDIKTRIIDIVTSFGFHPACADDIIKFGFLDYYPSHGRSNEDIIEMWYGDY